MTPGPIAINAATFIGYKKPEFWSGALHIGVIPLLADYAIVTITYLKLKNQAWFKNVFSKLRLLSLD
jgi:chromate transporter